KNPYNVSLYVTNLILLNYEMVSEDISDTDFLINDKIEPFLKLFEGKAIVTTTDIGKKYYDEEGKDINSISEAIAEMLSLEDESDILNLLLTIIDSTRCYLA